MGLRTALRLLREAENGGTVGAPVARRPAAVVGSPWASGDLERIVWSDIYGSDMPYPLTRARAMSIPAVARARGLLTSSIARCPLIAMRADVPVTPQPTWTYRTDGVVPPQARALWTVDDVIFNGWSLWAVERDADGYLLTALRVPPEWWQLDQDGVVWLNGQQPDPRSVKLIGGPHEGILNFGNDALSAASKLEATAARYASNPAPVVELHETSEYSMDDDERAALRTDWMTARNDPMGAVAFTNNAIDLRVHGAVPENLLLQGRNAAAVDAARIVGVPAAMVDATVAESSLTYETVNGRAGQFLDYGVTAYADAIASWLSMDDVVPRGQRVAFDLTQLQTLAPSPTGAPTED